eukprot:GHVO01015322.1.p1 GENE.GHVO01015322.1~~GHVO01015322.1.p1  ORF type:complete len:165 (-),score=24.46 GHVO01015322.1:168-662(-)
MQQKLGLVVLFLTLALAVSYTQAASLPRPTTTDESLPDILGHLEDVLKSLKTYLVNQQTEKEIEESKEIERRNEEGPQGFPEFRELDPRHVAEEGPQGWPEVSERDLEELHKTNTDVSLKDVLTYLLDMERDRKSNEAKTQHVRDHDIPFPITSKGRQNTGSQD